MMEDKQAFCKGRTAAETIAVMESTLKGKALVAAVESGLLKEERKGYEISKFEKFWEMLQPSLICFEQSAYKRGARNGMLSPAASEAEETRNKVSGENAADAGAENADQ